MATMKPRHAATLALLGWYLMIPPLTQKGPDTFGLPPDTSAPLSKWTYARTDLFDTKEECETELKNRQDSSARGIRSEGWSQFGGRSMGSGLGSMFEEQQKLGRCIPDTDPGIKRD
jgi:hypothetical protein